MLVGTHALCSSYAQCAPLHVPVRRVRQCACLRAVPASQCASLHAVLACQCARIRAVRANADTCASFYVQRAPTSSFSAQCTQRMPPFPPAPSGTCKGNAQQTPVLLISTPPSPSHASSSSYKDALLCSPASTHSKHNSSKFSSDNEYIQGKAHQNFLKQNLEAHGACATAQASTHSRRLHKLEIVLILKN